MNNNSSRHVAHADESGRHITLHNKNIKTSPHITIDGACALNDIFLSCVLWNCVEFETKTKSSGWGEKFEARKWLWGILGFKKIEGISVL